MFCNVHKCKWHQRYEGTCQMFFLFGQLTSFDKIECCVYRPKAGEREVGLPDPTGRDAFFGVTIITPPAAYHL